jgi:hypothetical protein
MKGAPRDFPWHHVAIFECGCAHRRRDGGEADRRTRDFVERSVTTTACPLRFAMSPP